MPRGLPPATAVCQLSCPCLYTCTTYSLHHLYLRLFLHLFPFFRFRAYTVVQ